MAVQKNLFSEILALWTGPTWDCDLARDMGVPRGRVRQWHARGYIRDCYWIDLCDLVEQRHGRIITCRQLALAAKALRSPEVRHVKAEAV